MEARMNTGFATGRGRFWPLAAVAALAAGAAVTVPDAAPASPTTSGVAQRQASPFQDKRWGDDDTNQDEAAAAETGSWKPEKDAGSMYAAARTNGVDDAWGKDDGSGEKL